MINDYVALIMAGAGGIVTIGAAVKMIADAVRKVHEPDVNQDIRLDKLEETVAKHEEYLQADNKRLRSMETGNRVTQEAILALLSHGIDGNEIESMKEAKAKLQQFLINK